MTVDLYKFGFVFFSGSVRSISEFTDIIEFLLEAARL
jgi:hypothetical protein